MTKLSIFCILQITHTGTEPTFVDEYVHIKLHVPKNIIHKHIHHYHHRRKPQKKPPPPLSGPLLENIILSELDKPQNDIAEPVNHEPEVSNVDTYTVIEETVKKPLPPPPPPPIQHVETLRIIEKKPAPTIKVVTDEPWQYYQQDSGYRKEQPYHETIKIISEHEPHYHTPAPIYEPVKPKEEIIKVIEPSGYHGPFEEYKGWKSPHYEYEDFATKGAHNSGQEDYVIYEKPKYVRPEKEEAPIYYGKYSKYKEAESYEAIPSYSKHEYHENIPKTYKSPSYHEKSKSHYEYRPPARPAEYIPDTIKEYVEPERETKYYVPKQEFRDTIKEYVEPKEEPKYYVPKQEIREPYSPPKPLYEPSVEDYHHVPKQQSYHQPSYPKYQHAEHEEHLHSEESKYYVPKEKSSHRDPPKSYNQHLTSSGYKAHHSEYESPHYPDNNQHSYGQHNFPPAYASDGGYEHQPPSSGPYTYEKPTRYPKDTVHKEVTAPSQVHHNTLLDELPKEVPPLSKPYSNIDWPEGFARTPTTETYSGHDSYSAGNVQGLDGDYYNDTYP
uniref:Uncharacterized protein n=1 Tax=Musca domestica TaxID=7370 RepID=A0A1I8ND38_MUSDO